MCSILLRQRIDPNTSAPRSSAYSARWLPTKPVIPVIKIRISIIVLHPMRATFHTRWPTHRPPPGDRQGERREGPEGKGGAPPRVDAAPHGAPADSRFGPEPVVVADGRDAPGAKPPDHEGLRRIRQARDARQPHREIGALRDGRREIVPGAPVPR